MGLDMYLTGEDFIMNGDKANLTKIKYHKTVKPRLQQLNYELGYWRKHPNLHGWIVKNLANGEDNCQKILLAEYKIDKIINAVKNDELPHTEGFFFGASYSVGESDEYGSYEKQKAKDLEILERAKTWLQEKPEGLWREIYYCAIW